MAFVPGETKRLKSATHWGHFEVEVRNDEVVGLHPSPNDPYPSPILQSIPGTLRHPTRIECPMVRAGYLEHGPGHTNEERGRDAFVPVDWDRAFDLLAKELSRIKAEHGNEAIFGGCYGWASAGRFHHAQSQIHRFLNLFGGYTYSVDTYSTAALTVLLPYIVGVKPYIWQNCTSWPVVAEHADTIVMFGGVPLKNAQVNPGGSGRHIVRESLQQCRQRGVEFINLSPLRDDAARFLDSKWLALRPNTDTAVMLGLAHTIIQMGAHDQSFLDSHCVGFERFSDYVLGISDGIPKDAKWAAAISGLQARPCRTYDRRAHLYCSQLVHSTQPSRRATLLGRHRVSRFAGTDRHARWWLRVRLRGYWRYGKPHHRSAAANFEPGQKSGAELYPGRADHRSSESAWRHHRLQRQATDTSRYSICLLVRGKSFPSSSGFERADKSLEKTDTIVIQDPWWTPPARHADIVLPATSPLERNDIGVAKLDPYMTAMYQAVEPVGQARNDFDIFAGLAGRLGFESAFTEERTEMEWLRHMYEVARQQVAEKGISMANFDDFWAEGSIRFPDPEEQPVLLKAFREDPIANPLTTPTGKIELYSETIASYGYDDCPGHPVWMEPCEWLGAPQTKRFPLHLISNQPSTRLHSQLDPGATSVANKIQGREPMRLNPLDAEKRGISENDIVRIFNDRGACLAGARITDDVREGVIELSTGAWYDPLEPGTPGTLCVHGNPNVLTRDIGTSKLAQGPSAHTALVEVERFTGILPEIRVFEPPPIKR